jgi:hypothetical protein
VAEDVLGGLEAILEDALHEVDAAAGRVHLDAQLAVGGAGLEAEPAVDAGGDLLEGRRVAVLLDFTPSPFPD